MKHVFGPVLSRRLGRSLGLDLLGGRICSLDCVYCECGPTDVLTMERKPYVPATDLMAELDAWLAKGRAAPDHVTLGGRGEPGLNTDLGDIIRGVRERMPGVPVAVLTNATCLADPEAARDMALADVILPSLDSLDPAAFRAVNRPHAGVDPDRLARSILEFRRGYAGRIWLEVLLVAGMNDRPEHLERMREYCRELNPDRVDVVTLTRPGAVPQARAVDQDTLERWRQALGETDDAARASARGGFREFSARELEEAVLASLARRPQTVVDLAAALEVRPEPLAGMLAALEAQGRVRMTMDQDRAFYFAPGGKA